MYWRAERSEWGAAGKDQRWFGLRNLPLVSLFGTQAIRPRRLETVPCPCEDIMKRVRKNTLIGRETEHRQSRWIKGCCFYSICPPATRKTRKASLICGARWYTLTKHFWLLLQAFVKSLTNCSKNSFIHWLPPLHCSIPEYKEVEWLLCICLSPASCWQLHQRGMMYCRK